MDSEAGMSSCRRPRYLIVINEIGFVYSHYWALAVAVQEAGWEVIVAARDKAGSQRAIEAGMQFIPLPIKIGIGNPWTEARAILAMRAAIRSCDPDVVHLVSLKNVLIGGLLTRGRKGTAVLGAITGMGSLFLEKKLLYSVLRPIVIRGLKYAFDTPRSVMSVENHDNRKLFVNKGVVSAQRCVVLPGAGLDANAIVPASNDNIHPVILCVTRMIRSKGILHLIDAAHILHCEGLQFELLLVGDIDVTNPTSLTREETPSAESNGVVKWLGYRSDIPVLLQQGDHCLPAQRWGRAAQFFG